MKPAVQTSKRLKKTTVTISIFILICLVLFTAVFSPWAGYLVHLGRHQLGAIFARDNITITWIESQQDPKLKERLALVESIKKFGAGLYELKKSHSFETYVSLPRKVLGWNLTVAFPLELKAREFYFPFAGKFGYLGFFDETLKNRWKNKFIADGFDVYENEIGAYSTLGYFKDPVYSTYLDFEDRQLARLILHEMAHEKIYFKSDSDFSESLASFIEKAATNLYLYKSIHTPKSEMAKYTTIRRQYENFQDTLDRTRKVLETVYSGGLSVADKYEQKKKILASLRNELKSAKYSHLEFVKNLSQTDEINNAFLVQNQRYTPQANTGFSDLLFNECRESIACWFAGLEQLKKCDNKTRKKFSTTGIILDEILKECK